MTLICSKTVNKFCSIPGYHYLTKLTMSWVLPVKGLGMICSFMSHVTSLTNRGILIFLDPLQVSDKVSCSEPLMQAAKNVA